MRSWILMYLPALISQFLLIQTTQKLCKKPIPLWQRLVATIVLFGFFMATSTLMGIYGGVKYSAFFTSIVLSFLSLGVMAFLFKVWKMARQGKSRFFLSFFTAYISYYFISTCFNILFLIGLKAGEMLLGEMSILLTTVGQGIVYFFIR